MAKRKSKGKDLGLRPIEDIDSWEVVARGGGLPVAVGARITVGLDPNTYAALEEAAELQGLDIIEFARRAIQQATAAVRSHAHGAATDRSEAAEATVPS